MSIFFCDFSTNSCFEDSEILGLGTPILLLIAGRLVFYLTEVKHSYYHAENENTLDIPMKLVRV